VSRYAIGVDFGTQSGRAVFVVPLHDYVGRGESNVMKTSRGPRAAAWAEGS
jgi:ribulose kinase